MHVNAIWVRRTGNKIQVLFERLGKWHLATEEPIDKPFSTIITHPTLEKALLNEITEYPSPQRE